MSPLVKTEQEPTSEKFQKMKKSNSELALMAKRLEEKAREIQRRPSASWKVFINYKDPSIVMITTMHINSTVRPGLSSHVRIDVLGQNK